MRLNQHTLIALAVTLATAAVAWAIGIDTGPALILGAIGGILASFMVQRRGSIGRMASTGSDEPADVAASIDTAGAEVLQLRTQATGVESESTRELANQLGETLTAVLMAAEGRERGGVMPLLVDQLIEPAQALLTDYLWLQKRGDTASRDAMTKISTRDLPAADHAARQVLAILQREGPVEIAAVRRAVDFSFSFGGETVSPSAEMWGNRQRLIEEAERQQHR